MTGVQTCALPISSLGSWDFDALVEGWDVNDLDEWGVKVPTSKNTEDRKSVV